MDEEFLKKLLEKLTQFRAWLRDEKTARRFFTLLIVALALAWYGSYFRHDLRFRDEGGTVALNAQRLLAGERPLVDVTLNYNVLWYYPVTALYKIFGVYFTIARVWFFALSAVAALIAWGTVARAGREPLVAFAVSLVCLLVPGMLFKNYIPLLVIANSAMLMHVALAAPDSARSLVNVALGGALAGVTLLVRIDLGIFFTLLWLGLHVLRLLDRGVSAQRKVGAFLAGIALTAGLIAAVHLPVLRDAKTRGFDRPFLAQYEAWAQMIDNGLRTKLGFPDKQEPASQAPQPHATSGSVFWNRDTLHRNAWRDLIDARDFDTRALVLLTWLPIATIAVVLLWTLAALVDGLRSRHPDAFRRPLAALVLIGGALTAFPQFFFFRPDPPHLSEFSPGYWTALTSAALLLGALQKPWRDTRWPARLLPCLLAAHATLYLVRMMPDRWTGTIAARQYRTERFTAENGVDALVSPGDLPALQALAKVVREHSAPGDWLIAYPYHPMLNVMTNRPTYEKDVYIDNSTRTRHWDDEAIARFEKYKPAIIVLSDWEVNGHEGSRFSAWAAPTKAWIQAHYDSQGAFKTDVDEFEVYTRR